MQVGLTVTLECNLACDYCYVPQCRDSMTTQTAAKAARLDNVDGRFALWGGEPFVDPEHVKAIVGAVRGAYQGEGPLRFALTTNATLLDESIAAWCARELTSVAVSIDGCEAAHDLHRRSLSGEPSARSAWRGLELLLAAGAPVTVIQTLNPGTVDSLADAVQRLVDAGVRSISHGLNVRVRWSQEALDLLRGQYVLIAERYGDWLERDGVRFSPFDEAIRTYVNGGYERKNIPCAGHDSVLAMPDGRLMPCDAFIGADAEVWGVGDVDRGIVKLPAVLGRSGCREGGACVGCDLRARCLRSCQCRNLLGTGDPSSVPESWCSYARMTTQLADRVAGVLYASGSAAFMERFYSARPGSDGGDGGAATQETRSGAAL